MNTTMQMPLTAQEFIDDFKFKDHKEVYTNGAELISVLRVQQMLDHYYARRTQKMTFGDALVELKAGRRVARKGWNGKNMSVAYQKGYPDGIPCNKNTAEAWGMQEGELFKCRPYLQMRCADGTFQMWLASQSDILADDWYIVE